MLPADRRYQPSLHKTLWPQLYRPATATCPALRRDIANCAKKQGRHGDAEKLYKQLVELRAEVLGAMHVRTLSATVDLAISIENQGRRTDAEALYREVLKKRTETLGPEAPDTLNSVSNVAICLYGQVSVVDEHRQPRLFNSSLNCCSAFLQLFQRDFAVCPNNLFRPI